MTENVLCAIIGIVGTVIGTVLGWILNNLSQRGKLNIYVSDWEYQFNKQDGCGGFDRGMNFDESTYFHYDFSMDIYNSSGETQIMRNVQILFKKKNEVIWKHFPNDDSTRRFSGPVSFYDGVQPTNIAPKSVIKIKMHSGLWESDAQFKELMDTDSVYLSYLDRHNKEKKFLISKVNFNEFFTQEREEQ